MVFFAVIMVVAALSMMFRPGSANMENGQMKCCNIPLIIVEGAVVGVLTGLVGAGGGFLIIPALVLVAKLPMKTAIGTSLVVIAIKSLVGFVGDLQSGQPIDWNLLMLFTALAIGGVFIGNKLSHFISGQKLRKGFAWFVPVSYTHLTLPTNRFV